MGVTIHFQNRSEMERQFRVTLFEKKLDAYLALLDYVTRADDDGVIDPQEKEKIRNHSEMVALVRGAPLVETLAKFLDDIVEDGKIDAGPKDDSFPSLVQAMRDDLAVVEGDDVKRLVGSLVSAAADQG